MWRNNPHRSLVSPGPSISDGGLRREQHRLDIVFMVSRRWRKLALLARRFAGPCFSVWLWPETTAYEF